jgi:3-hydroxybutyryl-CoA dehydrogenase
MNILVIGEPDNLAECQKKFGDIHHYSLAPEHREAEKFLVTNDLVFDFIISEEPHEFEIYLNTSIKVMINAAKISLAELTHMVSRPLPGRLFGFNGLPTFVNRTLLETSLWSKDDEPELQRICQTLKTPYSLVDDRVGLVTPRIICMIINEAYYTVQEGTATREDIDMAMKLGTNYPYGPFEWTRRIGIRHVYEVLEAVYDDTQDERYKICPLLKQEYLKALTWQR